MDEYIERIEKQQRDGTTRFALQSSPSLQHEHSGYYMVHGGLRFRRFIEQHVPELLVDMGDDQLGCSWLCRGGKFYLRSLLVTPQTDVSEWMLGYRMVTQDALVLQLLKARVITHGGDLEEINLQIKGHREVMQLVQDGFVRTPLVHLVPLLRKRMSRSGEHLLLYTLKRLVRFERKGNSRGYTLDEEAEMAVLMRFTCEVLGLAGSVSPDGLTPPLPSKPWVDRIGRHDDHASFTVKGWPASPRRVLPRSEYKVYYREIRDPRFRRFSK